ncbi:MAG: hypothetical protein GF372_14665 [Candidatus Marinimicrobia bacterium]|nr:hypothetical protein [Candidatus Neomarinimicrobiota bacterium]
MKRSGTHICVPADKFWSLVFDCCDGDPELRFKMVTHTGEQIAAYFNAGFFVVRPEHRLLAQWHEALVKLFIRPQFTTWYGKNSLYKVFMHQAVFTAVLLANTEPSQFQLLSEAYNYLLHLHEHLPVDRKTASVDDLASVRFEDIFDNGFCQNFPMS